MGDANPALRVLLVDDTDSDLGLLRDALGEAGYTVVAEARSALDLFDQVAKCRPDVIIIDTESPTRDALEQVCLVTQSDPRPIVMFTADGERDSIRAAIEAGVTTYIVEGLAAHRVRPIVEVAQARFAADRALRAELVKTRSRLEERKLVERAKGLLMKARGIDEDAAFAALRRLAMDRQSSLVDVSRQVIDAGKLLG